MDMPCQDPEGCKHFKVEMKLQAKNKRLERKIRRIKRLEKRYIDSSHCLFTMGYAAINIAEALKNK